MLEVKLTIFLFVFYFLRFSLADYLSLDGSDWKAISANKSIVSKALVPGSIYSDLRREKILKQNLYLDYNDVNYRWVSYDNWTYERTFNVGASLLYKKSVILVANGIDTISSIYINDRLIGKTDNMFIRYKYDVKNDLKTGQNSIKIVFQSAPHYAQQSYDEYKNKYGYIVIPDGVGPEVHGEPHSNFIRKMASSFAWDWGPAFPTQGIWKSIGIEANDKPIIRDITVETTPDVKNTSKWTLTVCAFVELAQNQETDGLFSIALDENNLIDNQKHSLKYSSEGTVRVEFVIPIDKIPIIPWYPNGVANNTQKLYNLKVKLSFSDSKEVSEQTKQIGFRKIELIQTPIKPEGLTFYFQINSVPFFAKGSNWIPANVLQEDIGKDYLRELLESARDANMNMLRVWGGGVYESDYFYELCDELGIMIWQDMMFACSLYPTNEEFLQSVDAEVVTQIRRLQHHPSIALWSGNNEIEMVLALYGSIRAEYRPDYRKLFVDNIKNKLLIEDKSRPFVTSSPSNGMESISENYTAKVPNDYRYGDVHYYNYMSPNWDWKQAPSAKFVSEYGFQSYPSLQTFADALEDNDLVYPLGQGLEHRQHLKSGTNVIESHLSYYMKLPANGGKDRLNDLIYLSQILQAMDMKTQTEFYRRNRQIDAKTGNGYTMGALYWQLNDIWQAPSWAGIEFGGKWKLLHSYARSFLQNLLVSPYEDSNQTLKVSLVRDDFLGELSFNLSLKVYKWSKPQTPVLVVKDVVKTDSFSAVVIHKQSIQELLIKSNCVDRSDCVIAVDVTNSEHKLSANNFMLLTEPKNSKIVSPKLKLVDVKRVSSLEDKHRFDITLSTEAIAPFVALDFKINAGISGHFLENGFFVFDSQKTIRFETKSNATEQQIRDNLTFKTLTDVVYK